MENKEGKEGMGGRDRTRAEHYSLSLGELQDIQNIFQLSSQWTGYHLLWCSDIWASSLELKGREGRQLWSLSREAGIDKVIGEVTPVLNFWRWCYQSQGKGLPPRKILHVAQENGLHRYPITWGISPVRDELLWPEQHTATDPDEVQSMWSMGQKFVQHAPFSHTNPLDTLVWKDSVAATVDEAIYQLEEYECRTVFLPPSSQLWRNCVINCPVSSSNSEEICPTPHLYGVIPQWLTSGVVWLKRWHRRYSHRVPCGFTCGTTDRMWGIEMESLPYPRGTSTWITGKNKWRISVESSCSSGQFLRQCGQIDFTSDSMERSFNPLLQKISGESCDISIREASLVEEKYIQIFWTV